MAEKKLPRYQISINPEDGDGSMSNEELGIQMIAYVAEPAITTRGVAFGETKTMKFKDKLKYRLAAPSMVPDIPIFRRDADGFEYEVVFSKDVIEQLYEKYKFLVSTGNGKFNLDHKSDLISPSYILEDWITGPSETDRSFTKYGVKVPEGSVFMVTQFTDKEYFQKEIIDGDRLGMSIEGFLNLALSTIKQKLNMKNKFEVVKKADGSDIWIDGEIAINSYVYHNTPSYVLIDGVKSEMKYPTYESIIELADGQILEIADSKIVSIKQKEATSTEEVIIEQEKQKLNNMKQKFEKAILDDGTALFISKMEVGGEVFVIDENGDKAPIFDAEHKLKDGSTIVTVGGKITEIKPAADAPAEEDKPVDEKLAEEVVIDAPVVEEAPAGTPEEAAILAVVQPKLDEIYKLIAELKTMIEAEEATEVEDLTLNKTNKAELKFRHFFK